MISIFLLIFTCGYLRHLKLNVANKAHVEASMCNQYLIEEASHLISHCFEPEVCCRYRDLFMHDYDSNNNGRSYVLSIFTYPVRFHGRDKTKLLDPNDLKIAHWYVLMNCLEDEPYLRRFISQLRSNVPSMHVNNLILYSKSNFKYSSKICRFNLL